MAPLERYRATRLGSSGRFVGRGVVLVAIAALLLLLRTRLWSFVRELPA